MANGVSSKPYTPAICDKSVGSMEDEGAKKSTEGAFDRSLSPLVNISRVLEWRRVIAASGFAAGGHRGSFLQWSKDSLTGTMALVPQVVDAVKLPVVAAGGI